MKNRTIITSLMLVAALTTNAWSSATRILDGAQITNGAAVLSLPTSTDTMVGRATTDTLTNKSISGASNTLTAIPTSAIAGSALSGTNTGDVTLGSFGAVPNADGLSLSGQILTMQPADATHPGGLLAADWVTFNAKLSSALTTNHIFVGASGVATDVAMSGDATIAASGALTLANTAVTPASYTSANITVDSKGRITAASSGSSTSPSLNGTQASAQSVSAAGGISLSGIGYMNVAWVVGNGGAVTVTATPSITACTADGQRLVVIGTDDTNTVSLQDNAGLSGSALRLNGTWLGKKYSVLELICANVGVAAEWDEIARR